MATLVIGIGIPGSGKTTFLKQLAEARGYAYVSPDEIRLEFTGDALDQSRNKDAWDEAYARMRDHLARDAGAVFDATFAKGHERRALIELARATGAHTIEAYWFDVPLAIAAARNEGRERIVPAHALRRMHDWIRKDPPMLSEGLDSLERISE